MKHNAGSAMAPQRSPEARFTAVDPSQSSSRLHAQRREHPRYRVDLDVSLGSDHNFYVGLVENLSAGGVFVATHLLKPVGEVIELAIHLPDSSDVVSGTGEVRWIREYAENSDTPPGMGIRFLELAEGSHEAIERFLARREPLFFED